MNDTAIKNFAVAARRQLLEDVRLQMKRWAIDEVGGVPATADTLRGEILTPQQRRQRAELLALCKAKGEDQLAEQAAYTWFNRFLAIRFMELHDYLPCGLRFFSSPDGSFDPQVLKEALQADIKGVDRARVAELVRSSDDEALFRYLFIAQCNELASCMPAVFERVGSAMELLLPESLLREGSVLDHMVSDIPEGDWREGVEIVGWMYQYYVSERKDEVFASFKKGKKAEKDAIAPATQLFTPNWIVRYLVENSLGRLWMLNHPDSVLKDRMKYYIAPDVDAHEEFKHVSSPEEITICDPACGSGHILVYAFELLAAMYEESGYMRRDIPQTIIENNLSGMEIDPRAGALASFALTMKALEMDSRFLRREVQPDIKVLEPVSLVEEELELVPEIACRKALLDAVEHMDECGSLYEPDEEDLAALQVVADRLTSGVSDLFADSATKKIGAMLADCEALTRKFDVVVANPPYMGSSNMGKWLAAWTKKHYPDSKRDLCTCFIERAFGMDSSRGYSSLVTMQSWMFLGSFEQLRASIINGASIISMLHIGARGFDSIGGEVVSTTATVFQSVLQELEGSYVRLVDFAGEYEKSSKTLEAIQNPNCGWFYRRKAQDFKSIPGTPIAYWASEVVLNSFSIHESVSDISSPIMGSTTGDNEQFYRRWWEVSQNNIFRTCASRSESAMSSLTWYPCNRGGEYRRWYGNIIDVCNWKNDGDAIRKFEKSYPRNLDFNFLKGLTWNLITSGRSSVRILPPGCVIDQAGPALAMLDPNVVYLVLGNLNTSVVQFFSDLINPTLNFSPGVMGLMPIAINQLGHDTEDHVRSLVQSSVRISVSEWDSFEISWNFIEHPLVCNTKEDKDMYGFLTAIVSPKKRGYFASLIQAASVAYGSLSICELDVCTVAHSVSKELREEEERLVVFQIDMPSGINNFLELYSILDDDVKKKYLKASNNGSGQEFNDMSLYIAVVMKIEDGQYGYIECSFGCASKRVCPLTQEQFNTKVYEASSRKSTSDLKFNTLTHDLAYLLMDEMME